MEEVHTIHHRAPWGNGLYNLRHEDKSAALTKLTWICRLNIDNGNREYYAPLEEIQCVHTTEKQPKSPAADLAFDGV